MFAKSLRRFRSEVIRNSRGWFASGEANERLAWRFIIRGDIATSGTNGVSGGKLDEEDGSSLRFFSMLRVTRRFASPPPPPPPRGEASLRFEGVIGCSACLSPPAGKGSPPPVTRALSLLLRNTIRGFAFLLSAEESTERMEEEEDDDDDDEEDEEELEDEDEDEDEEDEDKRVTGPVEEERE